MLHIIRSDFAFLRNIKFELTFATVVLVAPEITIATSSDRPIAL